MKTFIYTFITFRDRLILRKDDICLLYLFLSWTGQPPVPQARPQAQRRFVSSSLVFVGFMNSDLSLGRSPSPMANIMERVMETKRVENKHNVKHVLKVAEQEPLGGDHPYR